MVAPKHNFTYYLAMSFLISTILFIAGIVIGLSIDNMKKGNIDANIDSLKSSIDSAELEMFLMDFFGENMSCDYLSLEADDLCSITSSLGSKLELYERSNKDFSSTYRELKRRYTIYLIKNWITIEKIKKVCNANYTIILYFYSNNNCNECDKQGYVLSYLKNKYGNKVMIFAIDSDLDMNVVNMLKYNYNISSYPTLIINNEVHPNFMGLYELEPYVSE